MRTFCFIDQPSVATTRPQAIAASAICWMRWMWLAKQAVMMRRPARSGTGCVEHRRRSLVSLGAWPASSALVESAQQQPDAVFRGQRADAGEVGAPTVHRGRGRA